MKCIVFFFRRSLIDLLIHTDYKQVPVSRDLCQVFVGGVSDGQLQRGDVITGIEYYDATRIPRGQAEDIIRSAGDTLSITVRRSQNHFPVCMRFKSRFSVVLQPQKTAENLKYTREDREGTVSTAIVT